MADTLLTGFKAHLDTLLPQWPSLRFIVAYSGGLDSTALLLLMAACLPQGQLAAAHLNHGLRGQAADQDQKAAQVVVEKLGLTFLTATCDVAALARRRHRGLEESARKARYDFLAQAAQNWGASHIATAHQADDQAETVLMNLIKGTGQGGLAGIPPLRPLGPPRRLQPPPETNSPGEIMLIRPLLSYSRKELETWLVGQQQSWVEDQSNADCQHRRNLIRHEIRPALIRLNPKFDQALGRTAEIARQEEDYWQKQLNEFWPQVVNQADENSVTLNQTRLATLHPALQRRLVYEALQQIQLTRGEPTEPLTWAGIQTVLKMLTLNRHPGLDLPGGVRAQIKSQNLRLTLASRLTARGKT